MPTDDHDRKDASPRVRGIPEYTLSLGLSRPTSATAPGDDGIDTERTSAAAPGLAGIDTFALVEELKASGRKKPGWPSQLGVLAVSLLVFVSLGLFRWSAIDLVVLVMVLLVHETGHYLAMRASGYRDLRMFFIPLFGAAVSGSPESAPAYKRVLVALAGPVPGIALGVVLAFLSLFIGDSTVRRAALMFLGINAFNLLPLLPFDGGHVLEETVFCRNAILSALFSSGAALALLALATASRDIVLGVLGGAMLLSLPFALKTSRIAMRLRRSGEVPLPSGVADLTPEFVQRALAELERDFHQPLPRKQLVALLRTITEKVSSRPPTARPTVFLLAAYLGAIFLAVVGAVAVALGSNPCPPGQFFDVETSPDKQLEARGCVSNDARNIYRLEGKWEFFHPNGRKAAEGAYSDGPIGGRLGATSIPIDGREGPWRFWYPNGSTAEECVFARTGPEGYLDGGHT